MAIPTPNFGLGQRRGVVDAIPGHGHPAALRLQAPDDFVLLFGQDLGHHLVDAQLASDGVGGGAVVAGQHDEANAFAVEHLNGFAGGFLDGIGDAEQAGGLVINGNKDYRLTVAAQRFRLVCEPTEVEMELVKETLVAQGHPAGVHGADNAFAG
jgi:hypothetical protein